MVCLTKQQKAVVLTRNLVNNSYQLPVSHEITILGPQALATSPPQFLPWAALFKLLIYCLGDVHGLLKPVWRLCILEHLEVCKNTGDSLPNRPPAEHASVLSGGCSNSCAKCTTSSELESAQ